MIMKHYKSTVFFIFTFLSCLLIFADTGRLYNADKLSSSLINCIVQDRYGYVWVGTEYGMSRFDGYRYIHYLYQENDTSSLPDNIVSSFLIDKQGRFWVGTSHGLARYDYTSGNFHRYSFPDGRRPRIYTLIENRRGDILIGTAGYGLYSVRAGHDRITREQAYCPKESNLFYTHLYEDNRGNLWQSSHLSAFAVFEHHGRKVVRRMLQSPCGAPVAFFQQRRNTLTIVCMFGILNYDYQTRQLADAGYDFGSLNGNVTINCATIDHLGNLYLGTSEAGVLVAKAGGRKVAVYESQNEDRFSLSTSWVNSIMEDKDQNLWVGCYKKGLYLINNQREPFAFWSFPAQNYTIGNCVSSLAPGLDGGVLCTVQNNGVYLFNSQGKIVSHPESPAGTTLIYRDKQGHYWVGTGNGLYSYDPVTGASRQRLKFASAGIYCITDDGAGKLYLSVYSKGLYIYDSKSGEVRVLQQKDRNSHGNLCNDWIRSLMFDHTGLLWIGTANGACVLDPKTLSFDSFGWKMILMDRQANAICEDRDGNIVFGTDQGLCRYNVHRGKVETLPHAGELSNLPINSIVRDRHDNLWLSTSRGIWHLQQSGSHLQSYVRGNGLNGWEYIFNSSLKTADGRIAFGTPDGVTIFYPDDVTNNAPEVGPAYLTAFVMDGKRVDSRLREFDIPYKQNNVSLEFSLLDYKNPEGVSYQYRIDGGRWSSTTEGDNVISFNQMKPGNYRLEVRAVVNGGFSKQATTIKLHVHAPFYATGWAFCLYFILFCLVAVVIIWLYVRHRRAEIEERNMQFLINATHDIRSPLTLIMAPLAKLKQRLHDEENRKDIDTIDRNAQRLMLLVNQILDERKIDKNQMRLHCRHTDMVEFVSDIIMLHRMYAEERGIDLHLFVDGKDVSTVAESRKVWVWIDRALFDKVISNLLSNALKFTFEGGEIDIFITSNERNMELRVVDSGIGLQTKHTERLFDRFYQEDTMEAGTGIGLNLCRNIVKLHGGTIKAYNRADGKRGACFEVSLPMGNSHLKPEEIVEDDAEPEVQSKGKSGGGNRNIRVLLVDDDFEIARYIKTELDKWYKFDYAPNGKDALKKLFAQHYDLVVSDVMMPELDGIGLLRQVKGNQNLCDIPIILLTSKSEIESRLEGLKFGADAYIAKPFNMHELHVTIDNLVDNTRRLRGKFSGQQQQEDKVVNVEVKGNNDHLMERVMKSVNENLGNPDYNVEKLTEEVGISRAQLHRKMKEITGFSTGDFIRNMRLEQAARLISEGEINITQVAFAVGFNNQAHFSTVFKKHFGMSPSDYAKEHGTKKEE